MCQMSDRVLQNLLATTTFVSDFTVPKLVNNNKIYTLGDIIEEIKIVYGIDINYMKAWRVKEHTIEMLRVDQQMIIEKYQDTFTCLIFLS